MLISENSVNRVDSASIREASVIAVWWRFTDVINWCLSEALASLGRGATRGVQDTGIEQQPNIETEHTKH